MSYFILGVALRIITCPAPLTQGSLSAAVVQKNIHGTNQVTADQTLQNVVGRGFVGIAIFVGVTVIPAGCFDLREFVSAVFMCQPCVLLLLGALMLFYSSGGRIVNRNCGYRRKKKRLPKGCPIYSVYHSRKLPVYSQFFQLLGWILMEFPILQNFKTLAIIKLQKRSESNVLSKLPVNKIYRKKRLRKCWNPTISKTPDGRMSGVFILPVWSFGMIATGNQWALNLLYDVPRSGRVDFYRHRIISASMFSRRAMTICTVASKSNSVEMQLVEWA